MFLVSRVADAALFLFSTSFPIIVENLLLTTLNYSKHSTFPHVLHNIFHIMLH